MSKQLEEFAARAHRAKSAEAMGAAGRTLARSANLRVKRMGYGLAGGGEGVLPTAQVRMLRNVLKLGTGWNVPHLKLLALSALGRGRAPGGEGGA